MTPGDYGPLVVNDLFGFIATTVFVLFCVAVLIIAWIGGRADQEDAEEYNRGEKD